MNEPRPPDADPASSPAAAVAAPATALAVTSQPDIHDVPGRADGDPAPAPGIHRLPLSPRNYVWIAGAALVVFLGLHYLGPVLTPFLVGAILAYLGTPIVDWAETRRVPRTVSTTLVVCFFGLLIMALFLILIPLVQAEAGLAIKRFPEVLTRTTARILPWFEDTFGIVVTFDGDTLKSLKSLVTENMEDARNLSLQVFSGVKKGGLILVSILVNLALIPVVMFYMLRDWNMMAERLDALVPRDWNTKVRTIASDIDVVLAEFLRGQLLVMLVLAAYYVIGLTIAGLDRAFAIGILTGILVFIPYVGFGLGLILGIIAAILQWNGWPGFMAVLTVYGIGQLLESYVLVPWLVGDRIGLHPLVVIFALLAFGQLFGFAGVLLALPVSAALLVGLRHLRAAYVVSPIYRGDT
ncbi:MAG: AI-2E family transporter [Betaproteobacteria bacterium]